MSFVDPATPNAADFATFIATQGVTTAQLPADSPWIGYALTHAVNRVLTTPDMPSPEYALAVYNLGFHWLLRIAPDQQGQTFFADKRSVFNLLSFVAGPVVSSGDQGTSQTLASSDAIENLSISAMDLIKTPWGSAYLMYAQEYGPNLVDVS